MVFLSRSGHFGESESKYKRHIFFSIPFCFAYAVLGKGQCYAFTKSCCSWQWLTRYVFEVIQSFVNGPTIEEVVVARRPQSSALSSKYLPPKPPCRASLLSGVTPLPRSLPPAYVEAPTHPEAPPLVRLADATEDEGGCPDCVWCASYIDGACPRVYIVSTLPRYIDSPNECSSK